METDPKSNNKVRFIVIFVICVVVGLFGSGLIQSIF